MVYRRRYRRRRRTYKKPMRYKVADMAYKAYKGVRYIKSLVNAEVKNLDTTSTGINVSSTGTVISLNSIAQGDSQSNRDGLSILTKYLFGRIDTGLVAPAVSTFIRIIFFIDKQQQGDTTPSVTDVLQSSTTLSPLNTFQKGRFKILRDKTVILNPASRTNSNHKFNIKLGHHIRYNGTSGTDIQKGGVYMLLLSNEPTNAPVVAYNLRLTYYDN